MTPSTGPAASDILFSENHAKQSHAGAGGCRLARAPSIPSSSSGLTGLSKKSTAPPFIAFTLDAHDAHEHRIAIHQPAVESIYGQVSDLEIPDDVTLLTDPDEVIATVQRPRIEVEEVPEVAEGEEAEGEEGAEGEPAATAEGAAGESTEGAGEES